MLKLSPNINISETAIQAMASTALEFSDEVVESTNPLLIEIFQRIQAGETTHEQEEQRLIDNFLKFGKIDG
ncbi:hypothetical protein [Moraxella catarrhalis]|uniref:hypothetical protein n=1 Tax=Moraxella catarrhalis TaxID=480 RepID=UPI0007E44182|nr:hypothetical protein [Moraxella catarrhalis]MPX19729.1 hypothetical protein [Moraxella catarrhalis]OAV08438.1 hypothetical protein AO378_1605 [Moraxella catarrhalis]OAV11101.1 hypothetical protein AO377_0513 [Moraxella catarrhalis]OAV13269.1 hypothetical protein AO375_1585 [Moraxella catarrhalis]OAV29675.1 hypothetical protein AO369_0128 [Moraxella catarrhalis]